MERGLAFRLGLVALTFLGSLWVLTPTILGKDVQDRLEAAAARAAQPGAPAPTSPDPWWLGYLPNKKVNLGLDLQGGIDLTLEVDTNEAVRGAIQRDLASIKTLASTANVPIEDIRRDRREAVLFVRPADGTSLDAFKGFLSGKFGESGYEYRNTQAIDGKDYWAFGMRDDARQRIVTRSVDQALETIRNRVDETGVKEPIITKRGETAISVQLPGETDLDQAIAAIGTTAKLEFILVDEEADMGNVLKGLDAAEKELPPDDFKDDETLGQWLIDKSYVPANRQVLFEYDKNEKGEMERGRPMVLQDAVVLTGDDVNNAQTDFHTETAQWAVSLQFKPRGSQVFAEVTGANVNKRFAIVLDRKIRSAPKINERIAGTASISLGGGDQEEQRKDASNLSLVLRSGALPAPVNVGEHRTVGASLGEKAIHEGVLASAIGCALVFLLAVGYYRKSGLLAVVSLIVNGLLVLACLALAGATLTLPGICGIALTIGMAVDCNIIIYERIREELREGKSVRAAVSAGFERAFVSVFDANMTTLVAGIVLYTYGTGPLRGFAVTLMIGIFTTLYTGVFVSRALMEWVNDGRKATVSI